MNIKLHIKHIWKKLFILPDEFEGTMRKIARANRLDKIRKEKEAIRKIYDLSDMD
jgi:DNA-binding transcriptional regulator GbsR (MarR family)